MKQKAISLSSPANKYSRFVRIATEVIVALYIFLWIYTGLNKAIGFEDFKFQLGRSPFLQNISTPVAYIIPTLELIIVVALLFKRTRLLGLYASLFLMVMFTGYIYAMLHYSYFLPCSCGGVLSSLSWENHLVFNISFVILAVIGIVLSWKADNTTKYKGKAPEL